MGRISKFIFALILGIAATLATGQIQSSQSDFVCFSTAGSCQATMWYGFPVAWRTLVSYTYPLGCTGPLKRDCILQPYRLPPRYDLFTFLLDTLFYATFSYGLVLFARLSYRQLFARLPYGLQGRGGNGGGKAS
ncbi:hypothetical protein E6H31_00180 [Candidatus Bathyarchaeota archaeon]|nr:MAG: hypothetical protein E6H31_00180 [Candidatus Bathyarchaeota archaeon]